jgi:hypothetical protein
MGQARKTALRGTSSLISIEWAKLANQFGEVIFEALVGPSQN